MNVSTYVYGTACGNMHGDLRDATNADIITQTEADEYNAYGNCMITGRYYNGDLADDKLYENLQARLDKFFKNI